MLSLRLLFAFEKLGWEIKERTGTRPEFIPVRSFNYLCELVGIEPVQGNRVLMKNHLEILHFTAISSKRAFKTHGQAEGISDNFFLIPSIKYKGETDADGVPYDQIYVALAKPLLDSIDNKYVKTIDLDFMAELSNEASQLLYTKVSYLLHKDSKRKGSFDYQWLSESMGLKPWSDKWRAKQQLEPAFDALVQADYILKPLWWPNDLGKFKSKLGRGSNSVNTCNYKRERLRSQFLENEEQSKRYRRKSRVL